MTNMAMHSFRYPVTSVPIDITDSSVEASLWCGVLIVEPDLALLNAQSLLLMTANYCVTPVFSNGELFTLRHTKAVALAILSDHLGCSLLGIAAETVRRQWPDARILVLGQAAVVLEDHLYDEQVYHSSDPKQLLADLERLYKGFWNQRSNTLDSNAGRSALCFSQPPMFESDPSKTAPVPTENKNPRDTPSDVRIPSTRRN